LRHDGFVELREQLIVEGSFLGDFAVGRGIARPASRRSTGVVATRPVTPS
jgi:hypothetical protein